MTIVGMWMAIFGYGLAYAGMLKLAGRQCGVVDAFRGRCVTTSTTSAQGQTNQTKLLANQAQQQGMIGTQPIPQPTMQVA